MKSLVIATLITASTLVAAVAAEQATTSASAKNVLTAPIVQIELEDFSLTDCVVSNIAEASGGKAVIIVKESSKAETTVKLPRGNYSVEFWIMAPSLNSDTVWVMIGDAGKASPWDGKCKSFPDHQRMPMKEFKKSGVYDGERGRVVVSVTDDMKELPIVITPKKTGMLIDRVVFRRVGAVKPNAASAAAGTIGK
ncbi:MAG: hypothetical protein WCI20_09415 [bacterium]